MVRPDWTGRTVVCLASGPSLTPEDCETARRAGHPTIVTNTTFRSAPWADMLFAFDARWWTVEENGKRHIDEVRDVFSGRLASASAAVGSLGVETTYGKSWFRHAPNSGACAISMAVAGKAARVVLLGFDCQFTGGRSHHHGDHPKGLSNCESIKRWPGHFSGVARHARDSGVTVLNATRQTALDCFERVSLEAAL